MPDIVAAVNHEGFAIFEMITMGDLLPTPYCFLYLPELYGVAQGIG